MRIKSTIPAGMLAFGIAMSAHAAPSIDFVDRDAPAPMYSSARCVATHLDGRAYRASTRQLENVAAVPLADLLAGEPGKYTAECTVVLDGSHERYTAKFEAVKLKKGEPGSEAPEYDEEGFAYGVKIDPSLTRSSCYDRNTRQMNPACLDNFYGNGRYYLEGYSPTPDVTFKGNREFNSNVGVFLKNNPRYPDGQPARDTARKAASTASPFQ